MSKRRRLIAYTLVGAYFAVACALLYWFGGNSYFCARTGPMRSTLTLAFGCTIWDFVACSAGSWLAPKVIKLRSAAPLLAGVLTAGGLVSVPFRIYRGYGHSLFEGTWVDVSCFFSEGYGMTFPFVMAPALAILSILHVTVLQRIAKQRPFSSVVSSSR